MSALVEIGQVDIQMFSVLYFVVIFQNNVWPFVVTNLNLLLCQVYFRDTIPNGFGNFIYMVCFAILVFLVLANGFYSIKYIHMLNIRKLINTLNLVTITPAVPDKESNMIKIYIKVAPHSCDVIKVF